jgi:glycosyltransferase involved in cell wall biosynthesis
MTAPLVSIVTPCLNQGQFLGETLASVAKQSYRPIQQIVIDGGSTDNTLELLRTWSQEAHGEGYSFEWVSEPDRGHADALNKGFDRARGDIIGWLNSDDVYFDRQAIPRAVATLQSHPDVDVAFGDVALISETSGLWMIWCFPEFEYERALRGFLIPQPTVFLRRCVTDKHRLDPSVWGAIDTVFWLQIGREHKFKHVGAVQAADRDHAGRISQVQNARLMRVAEEARRAYGLPKELGSIRKAEDFVVRGLMRLKGLRYWVNLVESRRRLEQLAFPMWIDSPYKVARRQLTMRIAKRPILQSSDKAVSHPR